MNTKSTTKFERTPENHSFNLGDAMNYGINAALFIFTLSFWIRHNKRNGNNHKEGKWWCYNSIKAWQKDFPYLTPKQIRTTIDKLVEEKIIITGNYNDWGRDRTLWYAFVDEETYLKDIFPTGQMAKTKQKSSSDLPSKANANAPEGKALPYTNTYTKTKSSSIEKKKTSSTNKNKKQRTKNIPANPDLEEKMQKIKIEWNAFAFENKKSSISGLTGDRKRLLIERFNEPLFDFRKILEMCSKSPWLLGKEKSKGSNSDYFVLSFDRLIKDDFYIKILEGTYSKATKTKAEDFEIVDHGYNVEDDLRPKSCADRLMLNKEFDQKK